MPRCRGSHSFHGALASLREIFFFSRKDAKTPRETEEWAHVQVDPEPGTGSHPAAAGVATLFPPRGARLSSHGGLPE